MFCPRCGSNQSEGKRFCTSCGTNLLVVTQALTGQSHQSVQYMPPPLSPLELERQRQFAKGIKFTIIGGGLLALNLFNFIFSFPFRGGKPTGFWFFISLVLLAVGISKVISHRSDNAPPVGMTPPQGLKRQPDLSQSKQSSPPPKAVFSASSGVDSPVIRTSELEITQQPGPSVTEDETQFLPRNTPPREIQK